MAIAWLIVGVVLLAIELRHFAFFALFAPIGAFAAAGVALVAPDAIPLQVLVARLAGERWLAISGPGTAIPAGTRVLVTGFEGTTLVVWPLQEIFPDEIESPPESFPGGTEEDQP